MSLHVKSFNTIIFIKILCFAQINYRSELRSFCFYTILQIILNLTIMRIASYNVEIKLGILYLLLNINLFPRKVWVFCFYELLRGSYRKQVSRRIESTLYFFYVTSCISIKNFVLSSKWKIICHVAYHLYYFI